MKILIFGRHGQIARELARRMPPHCDAIFVGKDDVDLMTPESASFAIQLYRPDAVINAAAWTDVDNAERHEDDALTINATAPDVMARECALHGIPFLHISTDYVFDGAGQKPFRPDEHPSPINAYGRSKLNGEKKIEQSGANYLILRTSWVFSAHGKNFMKTMLRLGREKSKIQVVSDQIGGPTPASAIADALIGAMLTMRSGQKGGIYHYSGFPDVSWAEFARHIMIASHLACQVEAIPTAAYPTPARRPANSRLDCSSFERDFKIARPDWRVGVAEVLHDLELNSI